MEVRDVGLPNDLGHRAAFVVVADGAVEGFVLADIEFGLMAEQRRKAGLRIEVDGEHAIAAEREILREMRGGRGFAAAALEVHHRDDLESLAVATMRCVSRALLPELSSSATKRVNVFDGIGSTADWGRSGGPIPPETSCRR